MKNVAIFFLFIFFVVNVNAQTRAEKIKALLPYKGPQETYHITNGFPAYKAEVQREATGYVEKDRMLIFTISAKIYDILLSGTEKSPIKEIFVTFARERKGTSIKLKVVEISGQAIVINYYRLHGKALKYKNHKLEGVAADSPLLKKAINKTNARLMRNSLFRGVILWFLFQLNNGTFDYQLNPSDIMYLRRRLLIPTFKRPIAEYLK